MRQFDRHSGPRFPALRALAFLLRAAAVVVLAVGAWNATQLLRGDGLHGILGAAPEQRERLLAVGSWLGGSVSVSLLLLALAELIKLFIHLERNTRAAAAALTPAPLPDDELDDAPVASAPAMVTTPAPARGSRLPWLEGDEAAEGTLLPGH